MNLNLTYTKEQNEIFFKNEKDIRYIIVKKGRRFGATQGAMQFLIEESIEGKPNLWGDTINSNIDRYFERYAKPALIAGNIPFNYNSQQKKLTYPFTKGFIDFRSADRPENWEGFGYKNIVLNEAGIILKNDYLYTNAVLPMLMDYADSRLFALGVPKGKRKKDGKEHKFYSLNLQAEAGTPGFRCLTYTSYQNCFLNEITIKELETEIGRMNPVMVRQEIYGEFVDECFDALWTPELIKHTSFNESDFKRIVIAIDPATTTKKNSDETGIVAVGQRYDNKIVVIEDRTGKHTPEQWASVAVNLFKKYRSDCYVAEVNQGGDMVESIIRQFDKVNRVKKVHAFVGKRLRAEPVLSLYEKGEVLHCSGLNGLENEMLTWVNGSESPNRLDSMVHGVTEFIGKADVGIGEFFF